ncbi:MAG TPA: PAS domain-containing protein, partial [Candidatus Polarisedimenticolaceae bacterium]|nr:PAS domain-containing protein [Candidatus Polarisedimenticolaceae bacterium]
NARLLENIAEIEMQKSVLSSGTVIALFLDPDLRVRWFTPAVHELFPLVPGDIGRRITDLVPKFEDPRFLEDVRHVMREKTSIDAEVTTAGGRWYLRRIRPFFDAAHAAHAAGGVAVMFEEITVAKRLEHVLRRSDDWQRRVLETQGVGVLRFDRTGTLIEANDAFLAMTGWSREDIEGRRLRWQDLTPPEWMAESEAQMRQLAATGHVGPYEKEYFRRDGSRASMLFAGSDMGDGTIIEFAVDVTHRKASGTVSKS